MKRREAKRSERREVNRRVAKPDLVDEVTTFRNSKFNTVSTVSFVEPADPRRAFSVVKRGDVPVDCGC